MNSPTNKFIHGSSCRGGNISISNIDGIVWERIKEIWTKRLLHGVEDIFNNTSKEIDEFKIQIERFEKLIIESDKKRIKRQVKEWTKT